MKYEQINDTIELTDYDSFDVKDTLECGQCFRYVKLREKEYIVIAFSKVIHVLQKEDKVIFYPCNLEDFENIWIDYFDLKRDYEKIKDILGKNDPVMREAINYAGGIHIINQDVWECLISFIISQNNRIPMIKQVIKNLSEMYGEKIGDFYAFPKFEHLEKSNLDEIMACKTGFRAKYILDAVNKIQNKEIDLDSFSDRSTMEIRQLLMAINGVGPKVSDCVILFSCKRYEVFPTDVWVKRVVQELYLGGKEISITRVHEFASEKFGEYAGFAQQYLFHYAREHKIGVQ